MNLDILEAKEVSKMGGRCDFYVSTPMYKELGSHCTHPHKKKADQTENQNLILFSSENWGHKTNCQPKTGKHRESQATGSRTHYSRQQIVENLEGSTTNCYRLECDLEMKTARGIAWRGHHFFTSFTSNKDLTVKIEESHCLLEEGWGEK